MKRILYLTFYFEPDLCAGSFRNSPLAKELAEQLGDKGEIVVVTTMPNRYSTYKVEAPAYEKRGNMTIHRISIPTHKSGFADQINSFKAYYFGAHKLMKGQKFDLVFASSSRLFTAYLGHTFASGAKIPLYLDIRDIFIDTMNDVLANPLIRNSALPVLKYIENITFSNAAHINLISGGFEGYFKKYAKPKYTQYPNGIDEEFLDLPASAPKAAAGPRTIMYAGNIGEGQGLHKIVPQAAKALGGAYHFQIIGDGGAMQKLVQEIKDHGAESHVTMVPPVNRAELLKKYQEADFLFIHLNDFDAFKKVLPSKVFELGAYDKPIIAGVGGFANEFIRRNVPNTLLFQPGDVDHLVKLLQAYQYKNERRTEFIEHFKRASVNEKIAASILSYLP